jgi:uncharacterized membrane protein YidH (DUF202 family)
MAHIVNIKGSTRQAKVRHPAIVFALVFVTLGIYYLVWYYKVNRELRDLGRATGREQELGRSPLLSLVAISLGWLILVPPFVSFYRTFQRIELAQEINATRERVNPWLGLALFVVGVCTLPVELIYAQSELNRVWRSEAASVPALAA